MTPKEARAAALAVMDEAEERLQEERHQEAAQALAPEREAIVKAARAHVGLRWKHQGRDPAVGLDCGGLIIAVGRELGYMSPDWDMTRYKRYPDGRSLNEAVQSQLVAKSWAERLPGDVMLFTEVDHRWPMHLGILTERKGKPYMVHAWAAFPHRKVVETILDEHWQSKMVGLYAYRGVA